VFCVLYIKKKSGQTFWLLRYSLSYLLSQIILVSLREAGLEYLHRSRLRIVEGDGKGTQCLEYNWTTLSLGDVNTEI
jgi:hypothetical protein